MVYCKYLTVKVYIAACCSVYARVVLAAHTCAVIEECVLRTSLGA